MLIKLLKHEFKNDRSTFFILYAIMILLAIAVGLMIPNFSENGDPDMIAGILVFLYIIAIFSTFIFNLVSIVRSYSKSLFDKPGYLNMTLPISTSKLLASKMIMAVIWMILSTIAAIASIFVLIALNDLSGVVQVFKEANLHINANFFLYMVLMLIGLFTNILLIYLCITVVNTSFIREHKKLIAFISYIVITIVITQVVDTFMPNLSLGLFTFVGFGATNIDFTTDVLIPNIIVNVVQCIIYFIGIKYLLEKKIEIE